MRENLNCWNEKKQQQHTFINIFLHGPPLLRKQYIYIYNGYVHVYILKQGVNRVFVLKLRHFFQIFWQHELSFFK